LLASTPVTLRAVVWDMGGVIVRTHDHSRRSQWEARLGLSPNELERMVFRGEAGEKAALGKIGPDEVWTWILGQLGLPPEERVRLEEDFWAGDRVDYDLVGYIRSLRPRYLTGLLSNAWTDLRRFLEVEWKIADAFDAIVISAEVGMAKPDPAIFELALRQLGVRAEETVYVDDMQENVIAAQTLGLRGVLFQTPEQAIGAVRAILTEQS